jgi:hypothetical protein
MEIQDRWSKTIAHRLCSDGITGATASAYTTPTAVAADNGVLFSVAVSNAG